MKCKSKSKYKMYESVREHEYVYIHIQGQFLETLNAKCNKVEIIVNI